jgi:eukaryotic-like serine/threonine-protein kinase
VTVSSGTKLGPYEILSPLGAGGMGEVYRARDTRLERTVAIKVLPQHLSGSAKVRQRFEREAKTISQLSHPHICALYDVGREGGVEFLVMEYLEGETLSERLLRGPLPLEQTLRYGTEIADALDKAHRQGVVHRDLKPGNVMLTTSGVKLLDFGLAKLAAPAPAGGLASLSMQPTTPKRTELTAEGTILGTLQYMAPEQLEGKEADARTDIFALGATLYEMATGRRAFTGANQASLISAIMTTEPISISTLQLPSPPGLDRVVRTCLAKDPEDRWQNAGDLRRELRWIAEGGPQAGVPAVVVPGRKGWRRGAWAAVGAALAVALTASLLFRSREPPRAVRTSILPPEKSAFVFESGPMALSPDGTRLAFIASTADGKNLLWARALNGMSAQSLPGTEDASYPFWSADSRFLGFFAGGTLKKIDASGGPPQVVCDSPTGRGGTWNRDGTIVFASARGPLLRVTSAGGTPAPLAGLDDSLGELTHRFPSFLPDGRHYIYLAQAFSSHPQDSNILYVGSLDSKKRTRLLRVNSSAVYAPASAGASSGYLLFTRENTLVAQPFDPKRLSFTGEAVPIGESLSFFASVGYAVFTASNIGIVAYQSGGAGSLSQLTWFDRAGKQLEVLGAPADYRRPRVSHDGRRVAVDLVDPSTGRFDLWIIDLQRHGSTRLTFGPADNWAPVWSPDDSRIAFTCIEKQGLLNISERASSGAGEADLLVPGDKNTKLPSDWSRDGKFLAYTAMGAETKASWDIFTFSFADQKRTAFLATAAREMNGVFSPDGHWLAYASEESGKAQVYARPFPAAGGKWQISTEGGNQPVWGLGGKELFYLAPDNKLMAVEIRTSPSFEAGTPKALFETRIRSATGRQYDVSADGKRFLINTLPGATKAVPITLVQNWATELKK